MNSKIENKQTDKSANQSVNNRTDIKLEKSKSIIFRILIYLFLPFQDDVTVALGKSHSVVLL